MTFKFHQPVSTPLGPACYQGYCGDEILVTIPLGQLPDEERERHIYTVRGEERPLKYIFRWFDRGDVK